MKLRYAAGLVTLAVALSGCAASTASAPESPTATTEARVVDTVAVVGDSISVGMSACGERDVCPTASWALGSDPAVNSIIQRLTAETGSEPTAVSVARPGATVSDRVDALSPLEDGAADLVLVLVGANNACTASFESVTPVNQFAAEYAELLAGIRSDAPGAAIVAYSVPNLLQLWDLGREDKTAVARWNESPSCRSLLADADSDAAADAERRAAVADTIAGYNAAIADTCESVPGCTTDDGAVFSTVFTAAEISDVDNFHPSSAGQAALAASAWPAVEHALR